MAPKRATALRMWGEELAHAREAAGVSGKKLAEAIHMSPAAVSQWEQGKRTPNPHDIGRAEKVLGTNGYLTRMLVKWVSREIPAAWTDKWLSAESLANLIHNYEPSYIPGLLQTEDYARAVLQYNRRGSFDVEERLRMRMERQAIFDDENPPTCIFVIDEYALRRNMGGRQVMFEQLTRLRELADLPDITVYVVPLGTEYYAGGPFMTVKFDGVELVNLDNALSGQVAEGYDDILEITRIWEDIRQAAASPRESLELIERAMKEWET